MISCIINKYNNISDIRIKNLKLDNIYKKCGYKNDTNFSKIYEWDLDNSFLELWSKSEIKKDINNTVLFNKFNINIGKHNKSIFIMKCKNTDKYLSLNLDTFLDFLKANGIDKKSFMYTNETDETNEIDETNNSEVITDTEITHKTDTLNITSTFSKSSINVDKNYDNDNDNDNDNDDENTSEYSNNSELSFDIYCYSDEEES